MALDIASFKHATKILYPDYKLKQLLYRDNPMLAMLPKDEKFFGDSLREVVIGGPGGGRSANFAKAQSGRTKNKGKAFTLVRKTDYATAELTNEVIEASENNQGALIAALETEMDMAIYRLNRSIAHAVANDGSGAIGKVGALPGGNVVQLANVEDIVHFEVDMNLQANPTKTASAGTMRAGTMLITAVDRDAGTFTCGGGTVAALAVNDFIYPDGDYDAKVFGIRAWIPDTAPGGGDNFLGVNRSEDAVRYAGVRVNAIGAPIKEALMQGLSRLGREGSKAKHAFLNFNRWNDLAKELDTKVQYIETKVADIMFQGIRVNGPKSTVDVYADLNIDNDRIMMLDMSTWKLRSLKAVPRILNLDGNEFLRTAAADSVELRYGYYAELGNNAPGWNANIQLA